MTSDSHFKGWARPGERPKLAPGSKGDSPDSNESLDALCGWYKIFQLKKGHRFSTDDVLAAWYGTSWCPSAHNILDLGSGIGTVAMVAAWRLPGAKLVTIEAQEQSVELARRSAALNQLEDRMDIRLGDFREAGVIRSTEFFDLILGSPPYFSPNGGLPGDHPQKVACRFELRGDIFHYCHTASRHLNAGGIFAFVFPIHPPFQYQRVLDAVQQENLVIVRERPVVLREGDAPLLGQFVTMKASDLPESFRGQTWREPPLLIRQRDGSIHPEYAAVKLAFGFPP